MRTFVSFAALAVLAGTALAQESGGLVRPQGPNCQPQATVVAAVQVDRKISYDCAAAGQDIIRTVSGAPIRRILVRVSVSDPDGCTLHVKGASGRELLVERIARGGRSNSVFGLGQKIMTYRLDC